MNIYSTIHKLLLRAGIIIERRFINKFSLTLFCFGIWITFVGNHSLLERYNMSRTISYYEDSKVKYEDAIKHALQAKEDLTQDKEKYARENYYMHKENEEVIIFE